MHQLDKPLDFSSYCFRASGCGKIMTEPREKSPLEKYNDCCSALDKAKADLAGCSATAVKTREKLTDKVATLTLEKVRLEKEKDKVFLSDTCKKYLIDIYIQERTGRTKDIVSKYLDNGLAKEEASMSLLSDVDDEFYAKNKKRIFDDYNQGECDIYHNDEVVKDIKSSWDFWTFYKRLIEPIDDDYYWQAQIYMKLWNVSKYELCYCLVDMPEELIDDEIKRLTWKIGTSNTDSQIFKDGVSEIKANGYVGDIPKNERVIRKYIEYNQEDIDRLHERIKQCRIWLNEFALSEYYRVNNITPPAIEPPVEVESKIVVEEVVEIVEPEIAVVIQDTPVIEVESENETEVTVSQSIEIEVEEETEDVTITNSINIVEKPTVREIEVVISAEEENKSTGDIFTDSLNEISKCKTVDECQALYLKLRPHYEKYPMLKETLVAKKRSITSQSEENTEKVKAETKPKPEAKEKKTEEKPAIAENKELLDKLFKDTDNCKTDTEVKELYLENRAFVDANKKLKDYMQKIGEERELNPLLIAPAESASGIVVEGEDISNL